MYMIWMESELLTYGNIHICMIPFHHQDIYIHHIQHVNGSMHFAFSAQWLWLLRSWCTDDRVFEDWLKDCSEDLLTVLPAPETSFLKICSIDCYEGLEGTTSPQQEVPPMLLLQELFEHAYDSHPLLSTCTHYAICTDHEQATTKEKAELQTPEVQGMTPGDIPRSCFQDVTWLCGDKGSRQARQETHLLRNVSELISIRWWISAGRTAVVFQDAEYDGAAGVADTLLSRISRLCTKRPWSEDSWFAVNGHLAAIQVGNFQWHGPGNRPGALEESVRYVDSHMESWQISCPGSQHSRWAESLWKGRAPGFSLEGTLRKQCLCWRMDPALNSASLLCFRQILAHTYMGHGANLYIVIADI